MEKKTNVTEGSCTERTKELPPTWPDNSYSEDQKKMKETIEAVWDFLEVLNMLYPSDTVFSIDNCMMEIKKSFLSAEVFLYEISLITIKSFDNVHEDNRTIIMYVYKKDDFLEDFSFLLYCHSESYECADGGDELEEEFNSHDMDICHGMLGVNCWVINDFVRDAINVMIKNVYEPSQYDIISE